MTTKMTLKELKELATFKAINKKGEVAEFERSEEGKVIAKFEDGSTREMKLDSVRRSWEILIEEPAEELAEETTEETAEQETVEETQIKKGSIVKTAEGELGKVTDVVGELATVQTAEADLPAKLETLEVMGEEFEMPEIETQPELEPEEVKEKKPAEKKQKVEKKEQETVIIPSVELVDYHEEMAKKHMKSVTQIRINGDIDMRIKQNGAYIMDVRLVKSQTEDELYKAKNMSIKDALSWMGYEPQQVKALTKVVRDIRKKAKDEHTGTSAE